MLRGDGINLNGKNEQDPKSKPSLLITSEVEAGANPVSNIVSPLSGGALTSVRSEEEAIP